MDSDVAAFTHCRLASAYIFLSLSILPSSFFILLRPPSHRLFSPYILHFYNRISSNFTLGLDMYWKHSTHRTLVLTVYREAGTLHNRKNTQESSKHLTTTNLSVFELYQGHLSCQRIAGALFPAG
jgi:hypothetical protein